MLLFLFRFTSFLVKLIETFNNFSTLATFQGDGDVYQRLILGGGGGGVCVFSAEIENKKFSFRDGDVVTCHLQFAKQN